MSAPAQAPAELHPAAQVQKWKLKLRGWLWNPDTTPKEAQRICKALLHSGHAAVKDYSDILAAAGTKSCWEAGLEIWSHLVQSPNGPDTKALNTALQVMGDAAQWEHALALLSANFGVEHDLESLHHGIAALGKGQQGEKAVSLLNRAQSVGSMGPGVADVGVLCYNAAIKALSCSGKHHETLWMLHDVQALQLQPDEEAYTAALLSCAELGEWQRALAYLDYMNQVGLSPSALSFVHAMKACANCGQWDGVLRLFSEMQESQLTRPVAAFGLVLQVCEASGKWEEALLIFEEFIGKGGILEEDLAEPVVKACLAARQQARVRGLLTEWDKLGFLPSYSLSRFVADHS